MKNKVWGFTACHCRDVYPVQGDRDPTENDYGYPPGLAWINQKTDSVWIIIIDDRSARKAKWVELSLKKGE